MINNIPKIKYRIIEEINANTKNLKNCQRTRLVHYCRICIIRAFLQAVISFLIVELIILANLSIGVERELTSNEMGHILCLPAFISMILYIIFILMFINSIVKLFCDIFTTKIKSKIKKSFITKDNCEQIFETIDSIQLEIDKIMRKIHFGGAIMYCLLGFIIGMYYMKFLPNSLHFYITINGFVFQNTSVYPFVLALLGFLCGGIWNLCDYYAEKRIDWLYIISDTSLTELISNPVFEDCKDLKLMVDDKKFYYVLHTFVLILVSLFYIGFVLAYKPIYSILTFDLSFISNQYILFFIAWSVLFYKYSYFYYYKTEKPRRKIFPHFYDF